MSAFLRKYNLATAAATHIAIPLIKAGSNDFARSGEWTPASGDIRISRDGQDGLPARFLPGPRPMGSGAVWEFVFLADELLCKQLLVTVADAPTKAVEDQAFIVETFGHANAMYPYDLSDQVRLGLTALPNAAVDNTNGLITRGTGVFQVDVASGCIDANLEKWKEVVPTSLVSSRVDVNLGATSSSSISEAAFASTTAKYQAKVWIFNDNTGSNDRYTACWFKNGEPIVAGITVPLIQVIKAADGADLVASTAMTEIGSTGLYRYNEGTNRIVSGAAYIVKVTATIDGSARTWYQPVGRDS